MFFCRASVSLAEGLQQRQRRVEADPVSLGDLGHDAKPVGREVLHGGCVPGLDGRMRPSE